MRKIILLVTVLFFLTTNCLAQNNSISSSQATINSHLIFKSSSEYLIEKFGQPDNVEKYFFEMEDTIGEIYHYSGLSFYLNNNMVDGFEILSNQYNFTDNNINIGNKIITIQNMYPISYVNRAQREITISLNDADYFVSIHYDSGNRINKIALNVY